MAFRAISFWRSTLTGVGRNRSFASSITAETKQNSPTVDSTHGDNRSSRIAFKGEYISMYMVLGALLVAMSIGTHTAKQQLMHSPTVYVNKKRRESIPELEDPESVISSVDKFLNKSFLRKVAHIQKDRRYLPDRPNPLTRPRNAETLKFVGVDAARH